MKKVIVQTEVREYLARIPPFDELPEKKLVEVADAIKFSQSKKNELVLEVGQKNDWFYLIRTGAVRIYTDAGILHGHFEAGDFFGYRSLLKGGRVEMPVQAIEKCLYYKIPGSLFLGLVQEFPAFGNYFRPEKALRLKAAMESMRSQEINPLLSTPVKELYSTAAVQVNPDETLKDVARKLAKAGQSAALVMEGEAFKGIISEAEFCSRVVAAELSADRPVAEVMTPDPITADASIHAAQAMLILAQHNIRHLPITKDGKLAGMLSAEDLLRQQSHNALYVVDEVHRAKSLERLAQLTEHIPQILVNLVRSSFTSLDSGKMISAIGEAVTVRLLQLAEEKIGAPPVPYAWITAGSLSRGEQTAKSDQDNALFLSDDYDESLHGEYFKQLSDFVCDGLDVCGYVYCPGDVMASNSKWRQPVSVWHEYFSQWINNPQRKALMYSSIFFDLRSLYGDSSLLDEVQQRVLENTQGNSIFLAHMAENALHYPTPLGLFRHFVLEKGGAEKKALNMKKRGVIPITDLARVYALASGDKSLNTDDRLKVAGERGVLSSAGMADLRDAYEFIGFVRLQHQARQIEAGIAPDNFVPPEQLSSLERRHLKDAFDVVRTLQQSLRQTFVAGEM